MGLVESKRPVVLIVEDEFLLRMDAVDMIAAAGFEVVEAANADDAIEILESRPDITVVFTDGSIQKMPQKQWPGPVAYTPLCAIVCRWFWSGQRRLRNRTACKRPGSFLKPPVNRLQ